MPDFLPRPAPRRPAAAAADGSIPVAIDCDPGIDDAFALTLAASSPELDLQAVTTVAGNVPLELTTANALALLAGLGRDDVPVAAGADRGLVRIKPGHRDVHGRNGLGGVQLPRHSRRAEHRHAVELLAARLRAATPRGLTIVAIGPLTNIALLIALHPELLDRIERVVVMGGSAGPGNVTEAAEYNVWADPEAAARVFSSNLSISLAQLQVTRRATLDRQARTVLAAGSAIGAQLNAMLDGYDDGADGRPALHDVVAVAAALDPSLVATRPAVVEVDTDSWARRGETLISFDGARARDSNVEVAVDLDVDRLRELLLSRIGNAHR